MFIDQIYYISVFSIIKVAYTVFQTGGDAAGKETGAPPGGSADTLCVQALLSACAKGNEAVQAESSGSNRLQRPAERRPQPKPGKRQFSHERSTQGLHSLLFLL